MQRITEPELNRKLKDDGRPSLDFLCHQVLREAEGLLEFALGSAAISRQGAPQMSFRKFEKALTENLHALGRVVATLFLEQVEESVRRSLPKRLYRGRRKFRRV